MTFYWFYIKFITSQWDIVGEKEKKNLNSIPAVTFLSNEDIPWDTPVRKAPGPWVRPVIGSLNRSATPVPILRTRPVGFPSISKEPTTIPENQINNQ